MKHTRLLVLAAAWLAGAIFLLPGIEQAGADFPDPPSVTDAGKEAGLKTAVLAGGCFWGIEGIFESLKGVQAVVAGYSGGKKETADYAAIGTGTTGHAESVQIRYDTALVSFGTLLKVFFSVAHDPTQLNYQGPDIGPQYRSVIFYTDNHQKKTAEAYIRTLNNAKVFQQPIVTEVIPLRAFYPAEEYHQDFMKWNPGHPYIVYWDIPKIIHLEQAFPELLE